MRMSKVCLWLTLTAALVTRADEAKKHEIELSLDKKDGIYKKGEKVTLNIRYLFNGKNAAGPLKLTILRQDGVKKVTDIKEGDRQFSFVPKTSPASYKFTVTAMTLDNKPITYMKGRKKVAVSTSIGMMSNPQEFRTGMEEPADFWEFWDKSLAELANIPIEEIERKEMKISNSMLKTAPSYFSFRMPQKMKTPTSLEGKFKSWDVKIKCVGAPVSGYLTMPVNAAEKSLPAIVSFHGASGKSARQAFVDNAIRFDVNPHGIENGKSADFYHQMFQTSHKKYMYQNADNRDNFYFRGMFLRVKRALDYVKTLPEYDGKTLIVVGNSQGGAQTIVAAALDPDVKLIYAAVPALCDHGGVYAKRQAGWPRLIQLKKGQPLNQGIAATAPYYDVAFFAKRIKAETYFTVGLIDTTCSPTSVWAAYNNITAKKHITCLPSHGHSRTYSLSFNKRVQELIEETRKAAAGAK